MTEPRKALDEVGADTRVVSLKPGRVRAWKFVEWGEEFPVDITLEHADPASFDALLLPGGVINPDTLRTVPEGCFVREAFLRQQQASRFDLSRAVDHHRNGCRSRQTIGILALIAD